MGVKPLSHADSVARQHDINYAKHAGEFEFTDDMIAIKDLLFDFSPSAQIMKLGLTAKQLLPVKFSKPFPGLTKEETKRVGKYLDDFNAD